MNDASRLAGFLSRARREEASRPKPLSALLDDLAEAEPDLAPLAALLKEKHRLIVAEKIVEMEPLHRVRRSRNLRRSLLAVAIAGGAVAVFQKAVDPVLAISLFCAGIAATFVVSEFLGSRSVAKDLREVEALAERYREFVETSSN